jgi:alpha-galactosidase
MCLEDGRHLSHVYYGKRIKNVPFTYEKIPSPFSAYHGDRGTRYYANIARSEFPVFGNGDFRATALKLRDLSTGGDTTMFTFCSARRFAGRIDIPGLPFATCEEKSETLEITMKDGVNGCTLLLYYTIFPESDVISRYFLLQNNGKNDIRIEKCMSLCLDIPRTDMDLISFQGEYGAERVYQRTPLIHGNQSVYSRRGSSSHYFNPFMMLADHRTT